MRELNLEVLHLETGRHNPNGKMCIMEAVAWMAGEPWSDAPHCACPVIAAFLRSWNDALPDDERQQLKQYILPLIGSRRDKAIERKRSLMALDWLIRVHTVAWLRLGSMADHATALESLPPILTIKATQEAGPKVRAAGAAAWDAAGAAARAAAWDAARDAAWDAAGAAAGAAARAAAGAALKPTRDQLIISAHDLVQRMLAVGSHGKAVFDNVRVERGG